jgi:hypothetical protein
MAPENEIHPTSTLMIASEDFAAPVALAVSEEILDEI